MSCPQQGHGGGTMGLLFQAYTHSWTPPPRVSSAGCSAPTGRVHIFTQQQLVSVMGGGTPLKQVRHWSPNTQRSRHNKQLLSAVLLNISQQVVSSVASDRLMKSGSKFKAFLCI